MKKEIDLFFITNIPSFYKIKLFNSLAIQKNLYVLFLEKEHTDRTKDFYDEKILFSYKIIGNKTFFIKFLHLIKLMISIDYKKIVVTGWDSIFFWLAVIFSPKKKNAVIVESSCFESKAGGLKGLIKRFFLSRVLTAFVPGENNKNLLVTLKYKGSIIKTYGVGIYNRTVTPEYKQIKNISNFLFVGRLVPEKNLKFLIEMFNDKPELTLNIIGYGILYDELKKMANNNIIFLGEIENKYLPKYYQNNDVLILPSISEPWGLVVEEALNNGIPVLVSNNVGCINEIVFDGHNGLVFYNEYDSLSSVIDRVISPDIYNILRKNVCGFNYKEREDMQIKAYLDNI
jgi:glycosyltransferase involved in cell wall biosynthesis